MIRRGFCQRLSELAEPTWTDDYVRVSYADNDRCGTIPLFEEPCSSGMCFVAGPPPNDRALHPWLYQAEPIACEL